MTLRWLRRTDDDGARWLRWPIRLLLCKSSTWFQVHGWDAGSELVPVELTSRGRIPGLRALVGQTYHLGPLKILFGRRPTPERCELIDTWSRYQAVVALVLQGTAKSREYDDLMREHWALMAELGRLIDRKNKMPGFVAWGVTGKA